jgi:hypothetical protein
LSAASLGGAVVNDPIADEREGEMSMSIDMHTLIWLFPISFMFHDFEEIIFWERWMNKNGGEIKRRVPIFLAKHVDTFVGKSTAQISLVVCLIFSLTVLSVFLATVYGTSSFFLLVSGMFFVHGFGHIGQSIVLRRYVPGVITSALIVIPYGLILSWRLIGAGMVDLSGLSIYLLLGAVLMAPFILSMHKAGEYLYTKTVRLLIQ